MIDVYKKLFSITFLTILLLASCKKDEVIDKNYFKNLKPDGWESELINPEEKFLYIQEYSDTPRFIIRYWLPDSSYTVNSIQYHPELYLNFYSYADKELINFLIGKKQPFATCVPLNYAEKEPYLIVTSPCYVNNGNYTYVRARELMAPLHKKFKDKTSAFNVNFYTGETE